MRRDCHHHTCTSCGERYVCPGDYHANGDCPPYCDAWDEDDMRECAECRCIPNCDNCGKAKAAVDLLDDGIVLHVCRSCAQQWATEAHQ